MGFDWPVLASSVTNFILIIELLACWLTIEIIIRYSLFENISSQLHCLLSELFYHSGSKKEERRKKKKKKKKEEKWERIPTETSFTVLFWKDTRALQGVRRESERIAGSWRQKKKGQKTPECLFLLLRALVS